jgi:hypothetical protein
MSWSPNPKEIENVAKLNPFERYRYFIKKVADWREVWSLWNDGWVLMADPEGIEVVPVWPHAKFAELCAIAEWNEYSARPIGLEEFLNKWIPGMARDNRGIAVFPASNRETTTVNPIKLREDLEEELANYE